MSDSRYKSEFDIPEEFRGKYHKKKDGMPYQCECEAEYYGDGINCYAVNPCKNSDHLCHKNADCIYDGYFKSEMDIPDYDRGGQRHKYKGGFEVLY